MRKVINPCICDVGSGASGARAFAKIEFDGKRLSICGVVGPKSGGGCKGSAGQCSEEFRNGTPIEGWTDEMLQKFCDIWDRWHLNDMRAACQHQRELGWEEQAKEEVIQFHYRLTDEAQKAKRAAEKMALEALRSGTVFTPSKEQTFIASLPNFLDTYDECSASLAQYYEPKKKLFEGGKGFTEKTTRGWVRYEESERGILCKPCPVCGYKYGTAWLLEEVPKDVIDWLFALPSTKVQPAWV